MLIPEFFAVTLIVFTIIQLVPGTPTLAMIGLRPESTLITSAELNRLKHLDGFDQPAYVQYFRWLSRVLVGDLGYSYWYGDTVLNLVAEGFANTLILLIPSLILAVGIGIPVGVVSALKQHSKTDNALYGTTIFFGSLPSFWYGLVLILIFSVYLRWLPTSGMQAFDMVNATFIDRITHMILPVIVLGTEFGAGFFARLVRGSMLEVLRQGIM